jgi:hypothetical protein
MDPRAVVGVVEKGKLLYCRESNSSPLARSPSFYKLKYYERIYTRYLLHRLSAQHYFQQMGLQSKACFRTCVPSSGSVYSYS